MSSKDVGIRIRVEKELREAFQAACEAERRGASDVLREFMRAFAEQRSDGRQQGLFVTSEELQSKRKVLEPRLPNQG